MATHDYNIANQTGANFRADLNNALSAILSNNASATEPTTTTAYMLWVDTTNNLLKMRNSADNAWITLPVSITTSNTVDIDGGTVNTITSLSFSSGETVTTILDEDDLSSDSASALATQQSIKAYVDSQVTAQDLDFQGDTGGALSIDLDSETFTISGGNGIDTSGALNTLTIAIDSSVVTLTDTQTLTNKTIDADSNTISNLEVDNLKSGVLDTDLTSVSASDDTLASSKAIKTYVDAQVTAQDLDLTDGTTSISIDLDSETLSVLGGTGVTSTASGNGVTLAIGQDVGTTADVTFNTVSADLTGDVTGTVSSIANHSTSDLSEGTNLYYTTARFDSAFSGKSTSDLTEGTNLYFTDERVDDRVNSLLVAGSNVTLTYDDVANTLTIAATEDNLSNNDTDDLAEGSTNLYYTDARARAAISVSGDLSYNSTTGVISFTERTDSEVRGLISASGDLSYNSTTGVISFTERTDAEVRGLVSASGDLSYNSTTGVFSFTERTDAEVRGLISGGTGVTYNNTTGVISIGQAVGTSDNVTFGDVIVSGDLTVSGTTTTVNTETINLADNIILFNSNATGTPTENAGIEIERGDATNKTLLWNETDDKWTVGSETFVAGTFEGALTGNVTGTVSSLANHDTDDLSQGSTNLYYADSLVDSHLSGGTGVTYSSGVISIGQSVGTTDDVTFNSVTVTDEVLGDIDGAIQTPIRNTTGSTIYKGQAVYVTGLSGDTPTVALARANSASTMPAVGIARADINNNATGQMTVLGTLDGIDTSGSNNIETGVTLSVNDVLYISATEAGNVTNTPPTGESNLIQNLGRVVRVSPNTNMTFSVQGAGRTNATPNLNSGKIFYGNGSNQSVATTLDTSIVPENTNLYYTDARANSAIDARVTKSFVDALGIAASTATTLATARDFSLTGDVTASGVSFDGSGNVALTTSIGSNTVGITELNVSDGTSGQVLTTDGAGNLSFSSISGYSDSDVESYLNTSAIYTDATNDRLGIGTSSPARPLHSYSSSVGTVLKLDSAGVDTGMEFAHSGTVAAAINSSSDGSLEFRTGANSGANERLRIDSSGNVGINTTTPDTYLEISVGSTADGLLLSSTNANTSGRLFLQNATAGEGYAILQENGNLDFRSAATAGTTSGTQRVRIDSSGNVGINVTNPSATLDVDGTIKLDGNYPTGTGNVALGDAALDDGSLSGNQNTAIGASALTANTTAGENTAVGYLAMGATTTGGANVAVGRYAMGEGVTTGNSNVAIGESSLRQNTSASNNTAVGKSALQANTTGENNTAFGFQSAASNTTGTRNVVMGKNAYYTATTGNDNVAIGEGAMYYNTTGSSNVAIGRSALVENTTASNNTAVGTSALTANTTGDYNTAVGWQSLDANTTGIENTASGWGSLGGNSTGSFNAAFGGGALASNTTASNNTAVGWKALLENTTGSENTAIGTEALRFNTASNNTAVGYYSGRANTTGATNVSLGVYSFYNNTTGSANTGLGYGALSANTTASNNTAVGNSALSANTTGTGNVAVGSVALDANTTANDNTALGFAALSGNTTGTENVAIGTYASIASTTASYNVVIGSIAGDAMTTASENTLVGRAAGTTLTTGGANTAVGTGSLILCATGVRNTAIGRDALRNNTGTDNTGTGSDALYSLTTGSGNTGLGYSSGSQLTTGAGNTFLGYDAEPYAVNSNYSIVLGYAAKGVNAADDDYIITIGVSTGSDRIYNEFDTNASWTRVSDVRYKEEITDNTDCGLAFINDLRPVTFKWKPKANIDTDLPDYDAEATERRSDTKMYGLIAQEVKEALDTHGITDFGGWNQIDDGIQTISQEMFIHPLIKAVQELSAKCDSLQAEINILKGE